MKLFQIPFLQKGDSIAVVASANQFDDDKLKHGIQYIVSQGFNVIEGEHLYEKYNQFAGKDDLRAHDLQKALDNELIKAIIFARGGYGTARIIDLLNFNKFKKKPKWICGYSDLTVLHSHINLKLNLPTLHSPMVLNSETVLQQRLKPVLNILQGKKSKIEFSSNSQFNKDGTIIGKIIGGNLSVLISILNSKSDSNWNDCILLIEDVGEQLYHIDRMMLCLYRAGRLKGLKGLIVGTFNDMHDNDIAFGLNAYQIINQYVNMYNYPKFFGASIGHDLLNTPLFLGKNAILKFENRKLSIQYE